MSLLGNRASLVLWRRVPVRSLDMLHGNNARGKGEHYSHALYALETSSQYGRESSIRAPAQGSSSYPRQRLVCSNGQG